MPQDLGERLTRVGLVTRADLAEIVAAAPAHDAALLRALVRRGVPEDALVGFFLSEGFGPLLSSQDLERADGVWTARLPAAMALDFLALPIRAATDGVVVAMAAPSDAHIAAELTRKLGARAIPTVARASEIEARIRAVSPDAKAEPARRMDSEPPVLELTRRRPVTIDRGFRAPDGTKDAKLGPRLAMPDDEPAMPLVRHKATSHTPSRPPERAEVKTMAARTFPSPVDKDARRAGWSRGRDPSEGAPTAEYERPPSLQAPDAGRSDAGRSDAGRAGTARTEPKRSTTAPMMRAIDPSSPGTVAAKSSPSIVVGTPAAKSSPSVAATPAAKSSPSIAVGHTPTSSPSIAVGHAPKSSPSIASGTSTIKSSPSIAIGAPAPKSSPSIAMTAEPPVPAPIAQPLSAPAASLSELHAEKPASHVSSLPPEAPPTEDERWNLPDTKLEPRPSRPPRDTANKISPRATADLSTQKAAPAEIGTVLAAIRAASDRDEVVRLACEGATSVARSAVFFALRKGVLKGWDGAGPGIRRDSVRNLWIPTSSPSTFKKVLDTKLGSVGPYGTAIADGLFKAAVGSRGGDVMAQPVVVSGKVVGMLVVDDLRPGPLGTHRVEVLVQAVVDAFMRIITAGKDG